ncbi:MAG: hypothetical protein ACRCXL_01025, partial [Dermatophilaceae bacterium]
RSQFLMKHGRRSVQNRRTWFYVLDRYGIGIMLAATDHGLTPTPDLPDIPTDILATRQSPHRRTWRERLQRSRSS